MRGMATIRYKMEVPWRAFHRNTKDGGILGGFIGREFLSESAYGHGKVVGYDSGWYPCRCGRASHEVGAGYLPSWSVRAHR